MIAGIAEGQNPSIVETGLVKLNANLTPISQQVLVANDGFPANQNDEVFAIFPTGNGSASVIFSNLRFTGFNASSIQFRAPLSTSFKM